MKNDEEVVDALLAHNSYNITEVPFGHQIRTLKEKPENIRILPENSKQSVLKELPDLISQIDRYELLEKIDDRSVSKIYMEYLKNLPIERQVELLTQEQKYYTVKEYGIDTNESHEKSIFPQNTFYKELNMFSPEAVEQAIISLVETAKAQKAYEGENWNLTRRRTYLDLVKIDNLPVDLQIKIALIDNEFISEMAQEAQEKYVGNNPMVFLDMPSSFKAEYVKTHPEFIQLLSQDERKNILYFLPNKEQLSPEIRLKSSIGTYEKPIINNSELYKKILTENWRGSNISASVLTDNIRDTENLAELSIFEPEVLFSQYGADFKVIEHSTRLDGAGTNNSGISIPNNMPAGKIWRELEEGCSTISGCVIEANNMHSCDSIGSIHLGFASVPAKQIVGMSPYDAHVSHSKRRIDPEFQYTGARFDYSEELLRKTAAQVEGIEGKDQTHEYNEATMMRMNVDASGIENYTSDGRIMPDYIIVYGSTTDYHKELAKQFGKDGKPIPIMEIHKEKYPDRSYMRAFQKEDHTIERESGEALKNIKKMVESDDIER